MLRQSKTKFFKTILSSEFSVYQLLRFIDACACVQMSEIRVLYKVNSCNLALTKFGSFGYIKSLHIICILIHFITLNSFYTHTINTCTHTIVPHVSCHNTLTWINTKAVYIIVGSVRVRHVNSFP